MANGVKLWNKTVQYNGEHGVNACPNCGSKNIRMTCLGYTYPDNTVEEWVGSCNDCGFETDDFPTETECIENWNGIS